MSERVAKELLERHGKTVGRLIEDLSRFAPGTPPRLLEAMGYSLKAGGKRLRPALVLETCVACGGGSCSAAELGALAIEMVHTFSLVHDDLPAMDDDDLRRGVPTNHKVFGEAMAILAGDGLLALAFEVLGAVEPAEVSRGLSRELARATGPGGMIGGQVLDIDAEGRQVNGGELAEIHRLKTGALLVASCRMGAIAAGAVKEEDSRLGAVTGFGKHIGLAFQIVDDILDVTSTPEQLGKATQKDKAAGKNTYPGLFGLEESKRRAAEELEKAITALAVLGERAEGLRALARFVGERTT